MAFIEPYIRDPYYPRSPIFFADFWGHLKFSFFVLILTFIFIALLWNVQPWWKLEIKPVQQFEAAKRPLPQIPRQQQRPSFRTALQSNVAFIRHRVQRGETLSTIAMQYGVDLRSLIRYNTLYNPNLIWPGDIILIPQYSRR